MWFSRPLNKIELSFFACTFLLYLSIYSTNILAVGQAPKGKRASLLTDVDILVFIICMPVLNMTCAYRVNSFPQMNHIFKNQNGTNFPPPIWNQSFFPICLSALVCYSNIYKNNTRYHERLTFGFRRKRNCRKIGALVRWWVQFSAQTTS